MPRRIKLQWAGFSCSLIPNCAEEGFCQERPENKVKKIAIAFLEHQKRVLLFKEGVSKK